MLFNTVDFGVFLVVVVALFWMVHRHRNVRTVLLLVASYFFYGCWNAKYLVLIVGSTLLDYYVGKVLYREQRPSRRKLLLMISLVGNLGTLATFKYYNFFTDSAGALLEQLGMEAALPHLEVLLPVGISFYTFQTLSYTIDIYRRQLEPAESLLEFSLFVAFFPQLVAGPIVRASQFLPQFRTEPRLDDDQASSALFLILRGLFKKIVIADFLGVTVVEKVFGAPASYGGLDVLIAVYGYAFQIYGDFSGYSDIAIGSARLMGFEIPVNFLAPYKARNLQDFWRRWHISLSTWLRDYLYIPLGGSRGSALRTYRNLTVTMVLGGLWHGANWTFVAWGTIHGAGLALTRMIQRWRERHDAPSRFGRFGTALSVLLTFHIVCAAWIFFRSSSFEVAAEVWSALFRWGGEVKLVSLPVMAALLTGAITHLVPERWKETGFTVFERLPAMGQAVLLVAALSFYQTMSYTNAPFIYFQF